MPRLPSKYDINPATPQPNRQILQGVNNVEQQAGTNLGNAVAQFGEVGMIKAREQQQQVERLTEAKAKSTFYQNKVQLDNAFDQDPDYGTYEQRYNEGLTKAQKEAAGLIKDPLQREAFMADTNADRAIGNINIKKKAFAKEGDFERGSLDTDLASLRESALNAPDEKTRASIIQTMQERIKSVADRGHIDQDSATTLQRRSAEDYAEGFVSLKSPYEQVKILKSKGTVADFIPSDKRANLIRRAEQEIKQDQALTRVSLSERTQDATAAYLQGQAFVNPPSRAEYVAAYGEQEGARRYSELEKTQNLGKDIRHAALSSPEELRTMLESADPRKGVVGEGFAGDSQRFGVLVNSVSQMQKEKQSDPATYLQKYNPKIKTLWDNLEATGDYAGYATAVTAEQERIGVQDVKLLPEQQAKAIVAEFNKLSEGGEKSADEIQALADQWGKNWPTVYKQLSPDLPPSALVIGSGVDRPTAEILARTAPLKLDDLKKGIPVESVKDINDTVATKFADFQQTLLQQAGGERTYSTIYDQAQRLALTYVARGEKPAAAVDRAYRSLVDDKYVVKDTYRIPRQYDAEAISEAAQSVLRPAAAPVDAFTLAKVGNPGATNPGKPANLVEEVYQEYPRLKQYDFQIKNSPRSDSRHMEFYFPGTEENPFGDKPGVEIFDKNMTKKDVFGEMLHYLPRADPEVMRYRENFLSSLSEKQINDWLSGDYKSQIKHGLFGKNPPTMQQWLEHQGGDAFFRGYLTGQYPEKAYTDDQKQLFKKLDGYLRQGGSAADAALSNIDVVPPPGITPEFARARAKSAVSRDGYWVTNADETGLVLYLNGSAVTRGGKPITYSFDQLAGMK